MQWGCWPILAFCCAVIFGLMPQCTNCCYQRLPGQLPCSLPSLSPVKPVGNIRPKPTGLGQLTHSWEGLNKYTNVITPGRQKGEEEVWEHSGHLGPCVDWGRLHKERLTWVGVRSKAHWPLGETPCSAPSAGLQLCLIPVLCNCDVPAIDLAFLLPGTPLSGLLSFALSRTWGE